MIRLPVPDAKPVLQGINSYYADASRLIEHYRLGSLSGCIHFRAYQTESLIFLDAEQIITAARLHKGALGSGIQVLDYLADDCLTLNFSIDIYALSGAEVYFWASLIDADPVYSGLSSDFTDLSGLIAKMRTERISGYIEVLPERSGPAGYLFFQTGELKASSLIQAKGDPVYSASAVETLSHTAQDQGATFNVRRAVAAIRSAAAETMSGKAMQARLRAMLEELLSACEAVTRARFKAPDAFQTLLKRKFLDMAERFEFLDPFMGEFTYANGRIAYTGQAGWDKLARGVCESVIELARENGLGAALIQRLHDWGQNYATELNRIGLKLKS